MLRSRLAIALVLGGLGAPACGGSHAASEAEGAGGAARGGEPRFDPKSLVKLDLLADTTRIAPGQPFHLAARFRVAAGWHIYWANPGDSGLATHVETEAPAGFVAGEARYPAPQRIGAPGDLVNYGYAGETALFIPVTAPAGGAAAAPAAFAVVAEWLVCREDACVPGKGRAELALEPATAESPASPDHDAELAAARARLPRPWGELQGATALWSDAGLVIAVPGAAALAFYPDTSLGDRARGDGEGDRLVVKIAGEMPASVRGVVEVSGGAAAGVYELDAARP